MAIRVIQELPELPEDESKESVIDFSDKHHDVELCTIEMIAE